MPIYEYACSRCGLDFEKLVGTTAPKVVCPSCRYAKVTRKFSVFGSKSGGTFTPSNGGGCSSCSKGSCSSCR